MSLRLIGAAYSVSDTDSNTETESSNKENESSCAINSGNITNSHISTSETVKIGACRRKQKRAIKTMNSSQNKSRTKFKTGMENNSIANKSEFSFETPLHTSTPKDSKTPPKKFHSKLFDNKTQLSQADFPDLSKPLPFVRCKIVFNFESTDKANYHSLENNSKENCVKGWKREYNNFVFYESITSAENKMIAKSSNPPSKVSTLSEDSNIESDEDADDLFTPGFLKLLMQKENECAKRMNQTTSKLSENGGNCSKADSHSSGFEKNTDGKTLCKLNIEKFESKPTKMIKNTPKTEAKVTAKSSSKAAATSNSSASINYSFGKPTVDKLEKPYKCLQCPKVFGRKHVLKNHIMNIHTGERPWSCSVCSRSFTELNTLKIHMRIHTGERPYQCSFCFKRFTQISAFHRHERIHTGQKPYKCSYCAKTFSHKPTLKSHEYIHTGERPYKCSDCFLPFRQKSSLKRHIIRKHPAATPIEKQII